jgi:hypothetical protein
MKNYSLAAKLFVLEIIFPDLRLENSTFDKKIYKNPKKNMYLLE